MQEENKRLDIDEIQDLEKRVDVLEGEAETPIPYPIYKKDLDDLNDRITTLEGGTPSEVKNPMRITELDSFEGRVEELEGEGEETIEFKVGDILKINLKAISGYLENTLSQELLNKEVPGCTSGDDCVTIAIQGTDGHVLDCYYHFNSSKCYIKCTTATSAKTPTINWESNQVAETLSGALYVLNDFVIENDEVTVNKDFEFYKRPHVIVNFADGNTEEFIATEDITIFTKEEPPTPATVAFDKGIHNLNKTFLSSLGAVLPDDIKDFHVPVNDPSNIFNPALIIAGEDTDVYKSSGTIGILGNNYLCYAFDDSCGTYLTDTYSKSNTNWTKIATVSDVSRGLYTLCTGGITFNEDTFDLTKDIELLNPAKVYAIIDASGAYDIIPIESSELLDIFPINKLD